MYPDDFRYTKEHEWIKVEGDEALVGITDFAQHQLGDVIFVELPAVGKDLAQRQSIGVVESVKAAVDVYLPMSGKIVAVNTELEDAPEVVNEDAFGEGWILRISPTNPGEWDELLDAEAYQKVVEEEEAA